jgi:hypothetical protein
VALVIALLGGLFHHHESESESAACSYCQAGLQTPVADLAVDLVTPSFAAVGYVSPAFYSDAPSVFPFTNLIPRAPPASSQRTFLWESIAGLG